MDKQHIHILITQFFENNFSKELILKFQLWFTQAEDKELKEEILNELWEKETAEANCLTLQGLNEINRQIKKDKDSARKSLPYRLLRIASILLLPIIGALLTYWAIHNDLERANKTENMTEYIIPDGEMRQIQLPDGSNVWLNAGSVLIFSGDLSGPTRSLFLNGEATFQVVKNPESPFIVKTQYTEVEALGTIFNVKSYGDLGLTEVTLEEGLIRVDLKGKVTSSELIHPNEQLIYNHRYGKVSKQQIDAELVAKWKEGYLVFHNSSFEEIVHTIERRFNVTVNYDIRKYGGGSFSIKYTPYENIEKVLNILETLNPGLSWTKKNNIITIK